MAYSQVFVTAANINQARKISLAVVKEHLAACAGIVERIESVYWWQGKVNKAEEVLIIMKTKTSCSTKLIKKIKSMHSYKVPEIIFLPIVNGNPDYLKWIGDVVE